MPYFFKNMKTNAFSIQSTPIEIQFKEIRLNYRNLMISCCTAKINKICSILFTIYFSVFVTITLSCSERNSAIFSALLDACKTLRVCVFRPLPNSHASIAPSCVPEIPRYALMLSHQLFISYSKKVGSLFEIIFSLYTYVKYYW